MPLLRREDFDNLPQGNIARWLELRDLLEVRLNSNSDLQNGFEDGDLLEYVQVLNASANELGLGAIGDFEPTNVSESFPHFRSQVAAMAARLSIRETRAKADDVLLISQPAQERLLDEISRLRGSVQEADLAQKKKQKILKLLSALEEEINEGRIEYSALMKTLAFCAAGILGTTSFLADAPDAITTIIQIVGLQKEVEDKKVETLQLPNEPAIPRLPSPPKRLPSPQRTKE
ncbi:hypothetical protein [Roseobacter sp.]|uniref:hypothetical protein n=1 Tax=Roseobacter sp. TaxID=1907202 RepID=UPI002965F52D|nr:hypothetical protein [Roseobacter sp.]MDW3183029.1 hypothetical protein [Roseobacter sp.]